MTLSSSNNKIVMCTQVLKRDDKIRTQFCGSYVTIAVKASLYRVRAPAGGGGG